MNAATPNALMARPSLIDTATARREQLVQEVTGKRLLEDDQERFGAGQPFL